MEHQAFRFSSVSLLCHQFVRIRKLFLLIDFDIDLSLYGGHLSGRENWGFDQRNTNKSPLCRCYNWKSIKVFTNYMNAFKGQKQTFAVFFLIFFFAFVGLICDLHFKYKVLEQGFIVAYFFKDYTIKLLKL